MLAYKIPLDSTDKYIVWVLPDRSAYHLSFLTRKLIANLRHAGAFSRGVTKLWQSEFYAIMMAVFVPHGTAKPHAFRHTSTLLRFRSSEFCYSSHSLKLCELTTHHSLGIYYSTSQYVQCTVFQSYSVSHWCIHLIYKLNVYLSGDIINPLLLP